MPLHRRFDFTYWLVNGTQQTKEFNGSKSRDFIFNLKPATASWNLNYYFGQEQRDVDTTPNPGLPSAPTQPGVPTANILLVARQTFAPGFLARAEYQRDSSNQRFSLTNQPNRLSHSQIKATLNFVYWWGMKREIWKRLAYAPI